MTDLHYRPSGRVSLSMVGWSLLAAMLLVPVGSLAAMLGVQANWLVARCLLTLAFGAACAAAGAMAVHYGKIRSPLLACWQVR